MMMALVLSVIYYALVWLGMSLDIAAQSRKKLETDLNSASFSYPAKSQSRLN